MMGSSLLRCERHFEPEFAIKDLSKLLRHVRVREPLPRKLPKWQKTSQVLLCDSILILQYAILLYPL